MSKVIKLTVATRAKDVKEEIDVIRSIQQLAINLSVENLKLLAEKSKATNINEKIQKYKNFI